jgi:hypothetical protein
MVLLYRWYLAEFDIDTFEMSDDKLEACKREISGDDKPRVCPVEFNGGHRKEIEVSQCYSYCSYVQLIWLFRHNDSINCTCIARSRARGVGGGGESY